MKKKPVKPAATRTAYFSPSQTHQRELRFEASADEGSRSIELSFSSDCGLRQYDFWTGGWYSEVLDHSEEAVDLSRLSEIGVALFNHDADRVIGRLEDVRIDRESRKGKCRVLFDEDERSDEIFQKVKSGTLRGVSVGFRVYQWEEVPADGVSREGIEGPAWIARRWEPYEISIVSCPADKTVGIGRSINNNEERDDSAVNEFREQILGTFRDLAAKKIQRAAFEETIRSILAGVDDEEAPEAMRFVKEMREAAGLEAQPEPQQSGNNGVNLEAERARATEIMAICGKYHVPQEEAARYVSEGLSVEAVCRSILTAQAEGTSGVSTGRSVSIGEDGREKFRSAARDGLRMRLGKRSDKFAPGAEDFRGIKLSNLARECVERNGESVSYRDNEDDIAKRAFATSDFPIIMTDLARVTLLDAYNEAPTTWQRWCGTGSASDFKEQHKVRFGEMPLLEPILEGGEYKMADLMETKDSFSIGTFGKKFALTRKAIINDELGAFARIPQLFGSASARTIEQTVYKLLFSNPVIGEDGKTLFHANHGNLAGTASALGIASLSAARIAMRRQTGLRKDAENKVQLNLTPKYLLISPELETLARQILYSDTDITATNPGVINPFKGVFEPVVIPHITDWSWYLAASASEIDTVEVAFLNGQQSPTIEQMPGWNTDGMEYKVRVDFGVWCYEYRGMYKNAGAQPA
ncbi:prohead protease/major capsid protein fusion protein [Cloacibacillus evryensis]|uniref:prohead protease/major capsid protein fusion protein n=1 Tax=Cloacibacillus evryensis TaxID=508460 RepID=UPI0004B0C4E6|nr:prohead protease/major capsid protein fusion protein [Cloacibacillus evryensis]MEA5034024.1 HK97 family phage prohead protease [Cloacibacillus evryensis]